MDREQKTALVKELADELKDAEAIFAVDYRGISVPQAAELRSGLRDADARFRVVKNRLTLRAADEAGTKSLKEHLEGPTALTFVKGDAAQAAKTIFRLGAEWELLTYKGGLMDGEDLDEDSFKAIARLPGRDQLNAQFAGVVASPLTGLVRGLGSMIQGLALQLGQIAEQGLVNGEAPEEEAEAPKEEAPKEVEAPAGDADESDSGDEDAVAEDASSDGEAESAPDPDPADSPEETSEEQAPEGEDAGQGEPSETGEGDQDIAEEPDAEESAGGTEEAGDDDAGSESESDETSEDSDEAKEEGS